MNNNFWRNKSVFVTGHTGFKGSWLVMILKNLGAKITGYSLDPISNPSFFESYYARGICFETLGNIAQAEVDYKRAIEINPEYNFAIDALENLNKNNLKYK